MTPTKEYRHGQTLSSGRTVHSKTAMMNLMRLFFFLIAIDISCALFAAGCGPDQPAKSVSRPDEPKRDDAPRTEPAFSTVKTLRSPANRIDGGLVVPANLSLSDVARERGLSFDWPEQPRPMTALDAFGAGCATFDADDDGWQDVLLLREPHPALFRNIDGQRFEDVTSASGLDSVPGKWTGCAIGDYNGDGLLDVFLTGYHQIALFKNSGGLRFQDVTAAAGLDPQNHGQWGASAGFMDLDDDAWLDLVVLNYVVFGPDSQKYCEYSPGVRSGCSPRSYPPERGQIWRNTGAGGFELVPDAQGMHDTHGIGLVLAFTDLEGDGRMDFYVGNDGIPADLLHNLGNMRFENVAVVAGVSTADGGAAVSSMGADWADFDRDGLPDLAVSNWQERGFVVFRALGQNLFLDCSQATDMARSTKNRLGFGTKWVDIDNDAWPDLFFVNGHVYDNSAELHGPDVPFRQPMSLFWNSRGRRFIDAGAALGVAAGRAMVGRGSATADFDNDGRVDLLAVDFEGPAILLANQTETKNHWLTLDLRGQTPNVFAYGARVAARAGEQMWLADLSPASSYLSSSDPRIHWGLGENATLDMLTIHWPSGAEETLRDVAVDQILRVVEKGLPEPVEKQESTSSRDR